jgi:2-oxoisovalerate dehydrogenase E2 component (dihydrolipoyl transacylase)
MACLGRLSDQRGKDAKLLMIL